VEQADGRQCQWAKQERLVRRAISGESEALRELLISKRRGIMYHALQIVGDYHDAEDIAQEVIVRVCRHIASLKNPKAFNGWLSRIVTHESYASLNKRAARTQHENSMDADEGVEVVDKALTETSREMLPQEHLEYTQAHEHVQKHINALPLKYREVLLMFYFEELSVKEIASVLDRPVSTVTSYLSRGRDKLKKTLEATWADEESASLSLDRQEGFSALIAAAFIHDAEQSISAHSMNLLQSAANAAVDSSIVGTGTTTSIAANGVKIAAATMLCALMVAVAVLAPNLMPDGEESPSDPAENSLNSVTPVVLQASYDAEVIMEGADESDNAGGRDQVSVNPHSARLIGSDATGAQEIVWFIVTEGSFASGQDISELEQGEVLARGAGTDATAGLQSLPDTNAYSLVFKVTDTDDGIFYVMRDFMTW
jgi:RNA polymerase sigma-70 factor (ECF subfamily)